MKSIGLIDYGSGNLRSVRKALEHEGAAVRMVTAPDQLEALDAVVLPGVGSFGDCARNLHEAQLWEPIQDWLAQDRPFLGVCLGYQLLFESSEESLDVKGLGHFAGRVRRFANDGRKIPHMGWNALQLTQPDHSLWRSLAPEPYVFFVHSYFPQPDDPEIVTSTADYGGRFAASVARGNVAAVQFHPEKSQDVGLRVLRNFIQTLS